MKTSEEGMPRQGRSSTQTPLSLVIPFLNEEKSIPLLRERLSTLEGLPDNAEFVFVSDGSTDGSLKLLEAWATEDPRVKIIVLSRNFGHQPAITAGLDHAAGERIGIMDADLQDPPEVLLEMYAEALSGDWDIVYNVRAGRDANLVKRGAYRMFYAVYEFLADSPIDANSGDFCVLSRRAAHALASLPEKVRFVRGLRSWLGLRSKAIHSQRPRRAAGQAQYSWSKLFSLALQGITSFSIRPLRIAIIAGAMLCTASFALAAAYLGFWLFADMHQRLPGFTTIVILILFLSGTQFLMLGILGEYIGQIFLEVKGRPSYLVDRTINLQRE
jgi:glycosyltransferase involved in cell wall biosynthesis